MLFPFFRCRGYSDDPFRPCFEKHTTKPRRTFDSKVYNPSWSILEQIYNQNGERFRVTQPRSRIICNQSAKSGLSCRIRTSRAIEFRSFSYLRILRFIQKEQYLTKEDVDIFQYFHYKFGWES